MIHYNQLPFGDVEEMNEAIIKNWNSVIKPKDLVYHLGDFGIGKEEDLKKIRACLQGKICLVLGNHDFTVNQCLDLGFECCAHELTLEYKDHVYILTHNPDGLLHDAMGVCNIHGHTHGFRKFNGNYINVALCAWDYKPVKFDQLLVEYRKYKRQKI